MRGLSPWLCNDERTQEHMQGTHISLRLPTATQQQMYGARMSGYVSLRHLPSTPLAAPARPPVAPEYPVRLVIPVAPVRLVAPVRRCHAGFSRSACDGKYVITSGIAGINGLRNRRGMCAMRDQLWTASLDETPSCCLRSAIVDHHTHTWCMQCPAL